MELFIIGIISYLMGSIPFGLILTKVFLKKDIREIGSGNIGATNALRTGNKLIGYSTLILDVLKAVTPVLYVKINPKFKFILKSIPTYVATPLPPLNLNQTGNTCPKKADKADMKINSGELNLTYKTGITALKISRTKVE